MYHSSFLVEQFQQNAASYAFSTGFSVLDEICVAKKARTKLMKEKLMKLDESAIWFDDIVSWTYGYVHSIIDNIGVSNTKTIAKEYIRTSRSWILFFTNI